MLLLERQIDVAAGAGEVCPFAVGFDDGLHGHAKVARGGIAGKGVALDQQRLIAFLGGKIGMEGSQHTSADDDHIGVAA